MKMVKFLAVLLALILLAGCGSKTANAEIVIGESELYSEKEIRSAMDEVLDAFEKGFPGCTLLKLWYDEESSLKEADHWAEQYGGEKAIVLYSNYWVDGSGENPTQNPNSLYKNWSWILIWNGFGWELKDCGY